MSPLFTLSKAELAEACPGSHALPWVSSDNAPARRGRDLHKFREHVVMFGRERALELAPEDIRPACEAMDIDRVRVADIACEVAFALDLRTGKARELGRSIGRDYSDLNPDEVPGTADEVALLGDDGVLIGDMKTGRTPIAPARINLQVRGLAVAACRTYGRAEAQVELVHAREDGGVWIDRAVMDAFDLDDTFDRLARTGAAVRQARADVEAGRQPDLREGPHCTYCPARHGCPARVALVRELAADPVAVGQSIALRLTPDSAREAYRKLVTIRSVVRSVEQALHGYAEENPIDLGSGRVFGPHVVRGKESVNGRVAHRVLSEMHGPEIAALACEMSSSKSAVREALRKVVQDRGGKLTELEREALGVIREAGGISRAPDKTRIEEHEVRERRELDGAAAEAVTT